MQAFSGNPLFLIPKQAICFRGTIAGNNMNGALGGDPDLNCVKRVQKAGIYGLNLAGSVIPQNIIDALEALTHILPAFGVQAFKEFARMDIEKG
jgi:hypothetical protein